MSSSSEDETLNPGGAVNEAKTAMLNMSLQSRNCYMRKYINFMKWRKQKGLNSFSEEVLLDYFKELSKAKLPSTLWAIYSMLKATLSAKKNIQIGKYTNLKAFIKQQSHGYISQKTKVFSPSQVETFLKEAPDLVYLSVKVALIFGVDGSCRSIEMTNVRVTDIKKHSDQLLIVKVMASPTKVARSFMILDKHVEIVEKYMALRPKNMNTNRFFIRYNLGKCRNQVIGRNHIQKFPRKIAEYLNLPNPETYTGHCFRNTASRLSDTTDPIEFRRRLRSADSTRKTQEEAHESPMNDTQQPESSVDETQYANIQCDTLDDTQRIKVELSEWPGDDSPSVKSDDGISEECEMPPSPRPRAAPVRRPAPSPLLAALERRRLRLDEVRARQLHARDMARLRVEERRIEVDRERNEVLRRIADCALALLEKTMGNGGVIPRNC